MEIVKRLLTSPNGNALLIALAAFLVYLLTLAPSVTFIDSGELAAVAVTLGITHPTGYPLFTLLGRMFAQLPIAAEEIVRLNMMSAVLCAAGVFVFYQLLYLVLNAAAARSAVFKTRKKDDPATLARLASACGALLLAFSETYWSQAIAIEVYSLHVLLVMLTLYSFFRAAFGASDDHHDSKWWYVFAFALGLSFTNHMTTILLAPGLLYLYFATQGGDAQSWKRIARMAVPFLAGFTVYLYLPFRAADMPALNWGNPVTLEKFLWHWTGKQYRVWIFSSTEAAGRQMKYFVNTLPYEFAYAGLILAVVGIVALLRAYKKVAIGIILLFVGCVLYAINYDIHDIDSYFLLAYVAVGLSAGAGVMFAAKLLIDRIGIGGCSAAALCISLAPLVVHYERTDESRNYLVEDYTMNMFASLQQNALVFSYQWDFWVSASYYYQLVKGIRPDVVVVDKELLRRSWYFLQLKRQHPWLIENSRQEVDAFLKELYKFEHELPYDARIIEARYVEMIRSFITHNIAARPVYVTTEIEPEFTAGMQRVPEGLALRVYNDTLRHSLREVPFAFRPFGQEGRLENALLNLYTTAYTAQGVYWLQANRLDSARASFENALRFNPISPDAKALLSRIGPSAR